MLKNIVLFASVFFMAILGNATFAEAKEITPNSSVYLEGWDGAIGSPYGMRMHPIRGYERMHYGVDISGNIGDLLSSIESGTVESVLWDQNGYGNYVIVDTSKFKFLVAHMNTVYVKPGQKVEQGDILGEIGTTGGSTGPHIHFEVTVNGNHIDPMATLLNVKKHNENYISEEEQKRIFEEEQQKIEEERKLIEAARKELQEERTKLIREKKLLKLEKELSTNAPFLNEVIEVMKVREDLSYKFLNLYVKPIEYVKPITLLDKDS